MDYLLDLVRKAQKASPLLASASTQLKNDALRQMGARLLAEKGQILSSNAVDVLRAEQNGSQLIDRLRLTEQRIDDIVSGLKQVANLTDPIGELIEEWVLPNGVRVQKQRVPFGVIGMIYEARPNVTVDASALAMKAGSSIVLRGGSDAVESNRALASALRGAMEEVGLPADGIQLIDRTDRDIVTRMLRLKGEIDVIIPRGGPSLIQTVVEQATVPIIETGVGNCHLYVDAAAHLDMALDIVMNGKTQRPSVCNSLETMLVHASIADDFLPRAARSLREAGVELRGCERSQAIVSDIASATEADYATEFLELIMAIKVVDSLEEALAHIAKYGTKHSEAIVTSNEDAAKRFLRLVDACAVYHNASTRFTDGFEFGFGAEIGISTQKLHARGPMGLKEITTHKYVLRGNGQVR